MQRRHFLGTLALASVAAHACRERSPLPATVPEPRPEQSGADPWTTFRAGFTLNPEHVHMSALFVASHPRPVREAIEQFRIEIDADPVLALQQHNRTRQRAAREAAAGYLGVDADDIALTDSTTMGLGLIYNGLRFQPGDEVLTTEGNYYVTHEAVRQASARYGATTRQIPLGDHVRQLSEGDLMGRLKREIGSRTRVLALTWVHSGTGLKLPLEAIGRMVEDVNASRDESRQVLLAVDGVHGFGVENVRLSTLKLDFFAAGCHKWLFGPRGTGILWASRRGWRATRPLIPSFVDDGAWAAWKNGDQLQGATTASRMMPGGFKAFEHQWALPAAFAMHERLGRAEIQTRTHVLSTQIKEGLQSMPGVHLVTPTNQALSAGIVAFDVKGQSPDAAVRLLRERGVIATVTPYAVRHVRLTPSILNTPEEAERALAAIRELV
jgi:isopenicillin-N epimerase